MTKKKTQDPKPRKRRGHPFVIPEDERPINGRRRRVQAARHTDAELEAWTRAAEKHHGGLVGPWLREVANKAAAESAAADQQTLDLLKEAVSKVRTP